MATYPYQDPQLPIDQRVDDLVSRMNRAELIGQLNQVLVTPENYENVRALARRGGLGSRITVAGAKNTPQNPSVQDLNDLQRITMEESRLGIPLLHGRDIIHGHRTVFPVPLGMAAAFDPEMVEAAFNVAALEGASAGIHWDFAPMVDIARDPRWGRIIEGFGEDPYLCTKLALAAIRGLQGPENDLSQPGRLLACVKHFIGYGASEGGRDYNTSEISANTLRNLYLPPYEAAIDARVASLMTAFQDVNGIPMVANGELVSGLMKEELHFGGFVVSDWLAIAELVHHRVAADEQEAVRQAFTAGVDMDMVSELYSKHLEDLLECGDVAPMRLEKAVRKILTFKFRLGLFEHPYTDPAWGGQVQRSGEHRAFARMCAAQSMVLLKNEGGLLPLSKQARRIAVVGPLANDRATQLGAWAIDGEAEDCRTLVETIRAAAPEAEIITAADWLADDILAAAARADVVMMVVGESCDRSGENRNVSSIDLPLGQDDLIEAVCRLGKPVVLVVISGRPLALTCASASVRAILWTWQGGIMGADAAADVLFGDANPGGRLPVTFPRSTGQIPIYYNFKSSGRDFDLVSNPCPPGYRHPERYLDLSSSPLYPFGFGLSYTSFAYRDLKVEPARIARNGEVRVSVMVTNTGRRAGEEVAQLYLQDCVSSTTRPVRELKGFQRLSLQPGESRQVEFRLGWDELSFYGKDNLRVVEPGKFKVWLGPDCRAELEGKFEVI